MLTLTLRSFLAGLLLLAALAAAKPVALQRHFTLANLHTNLNCPKGNSLFAARSEGLVRGRSAHEVWQRAGDWCRPKWRDDIELSGRHECTNAPASVRAYTLHGTEVVERLNKVVGSSTPKRWETWFAHSSSWVPQRGGTTLHGAQLSNVHVLFKVEQKKAGARVRWTAVGCSTNTAKSRAMFEDLHAGAIARLESHFAS
ncbi:hypothetical protein Q8F55_005503 [Vanrija albida]|uniref:Uncharacterized protein n=1 Tax=Vanrija albida TaxID=181172 RepID=A0ABR3Q1T8_9TREE